MTLINIIFIFLLNINHRDYSTNKLLERDSIDFIIFGQFCGSSWNNNFMYKLDMKNGHLYCDTTRSFFRFGKTWADHGDTLEFTTEIVDSNKTKRVIDIQNQIPDKLLRSKETKINYGCPDCHDQCGLYFEFRQGTRRRQFYIDYNSNDLQKQIRDFSKTLKRTINEINN